MPLSRDDHKEAHRVEAEKKRKATQREDGEAVVARGRRA
jgi:hypothetical protein